GMGGDHWSEGFPLADSKGRSSTHVNAVWDASGNLWMAWPTDGRIAGDYHRPLRQQVYAAQIRAGAAAAGLTVAPASESVEQKEGHTDEPGDLRAIRAYTVAIGGKQRHI